MKKLLLAGLVGAIAVILLLLVYTRSNTIAPIVQGGFTDSEIRQCEQTIREHYLDQSKNSSGLSTSPTDKQEVDNGSITVEVHMIKVADRKLEGFAKIHINAQEAKDVGLSEIMQTCEATMEMNSSQFIWKCKAER